VINVETMRYDPKKNQGIKYDGAIKRIYSFSVEEKLEVVLMSLIHDLGKEV